MRPSAGLNAMVNVEVRVTLGVEVYLFKRSTVGSNREYLVAGSSEVVDV